MTRNTEEKKRERERGRDEGREGRRKGEGEKEKKEIHIWAIKIFTEVTPI